MSHKKLAGFQRRYIDGAKACQSFQGYATAIQTFHGTDVIVMAATQAKLVDAVKELNPEIRIDVAMFIPANIIHRDNVINEEL